VLTGVHHAHTHRRLAGERVHDRRNLDEVRARAHDNQELKAGRIVGIRLLAYTDYVYRRDGPAVYAERAFSLFLERVGAELGGLTVLGRLGPGVGPAHYRLAGDVAFIGLPYYPTLVGPGAAGALPRTFVRGWRALRDADAAWLLGPHPFALGFALMAWARGRRVVLGVRQDTPAYVRSRHPGRRLLHVAADGVDGGFRALARVCPVVVVGPELARRYAGSRRCLEIAVSLISAEDLIDAQQFRARAYDGELRLLSVGRLEAEKNPLLLADVLAALRSREPRWRLVVCGEGPLRDALRARLESLGLGAHADLLGYVPLRPDLLHVYRDSHAFLHVSLTEGVPQVLLEAFASRVPVVATAVGGVAEAAGGAAMLVPARDAAAIAGALERIAAEPALRERLTSTGAARAAQRTLEGEARRVARFIAASPPGRSLRR
jgi:glycosyltransferase involved in cell wall biosynthesis